MSSQGSFVSTSNYFHPHQSHLQPFSSFASPVQSASASNPYSHSMSRSSARSTQVHPLTEFVLTPADQYSAYTGTSSPQLSSSTSPSNFDYSHGYNSANLPSSSTYSYISNCSTSYSPYSQPPSGNASSTSSTIPNPTNATSLPYQSSSSSQAGECNSLSEPTPNRV